MLIFHQIWSNSFNPYIKILIVAITLEATINHMEIWPFISTQSVHIFRNFVEQLAPSQPLFLLLLMFIARLYGKVKNILRVQYQQNISWESSEKETRTSENHGPVSGTLGSVRLNGPPVREQPGGVVIRDGGERAFRQAKPLSMRTLWECVINKVYPGARRERC